MIIEDAISLLAKGKEAFLNNEAQVAIGYFEQSIQLERTPEACSLLAYCLAAQRRNYQDAISLAKEAVDQEPDNPQHYLHYGRILSMAEDRYGAEAIFRKGMEYGMHFEFIKELEWMGIKKTPIIRGLPHGHLLNKLLGCILRKSKSR